LDFGWELDNLEKFFKHKDLFTAGNFVAFKKKAEIDDIGLNNLIKQMRKCNPKPGQDFVDDISCYAIADLIFSLDGDCNVFVQLNSKAQPKLTIDESLFEKALRGDPSYARAKRTDAMWIMSAMRQRAENLQKLGNTIVNHQRDFFVHGISHMRPMTLKQVAIETGLHESTVSRLTLDKFASTPFGLIHMKNFFSASLKNISNDDDVSAKSVQKTLKDLIESEDPEHIYSDDALVFELAQRGISISRRTIAKYRDVLKIPSSYERARMSKTNRFFINSLG
jgi:RNA polymerase sigma-54 factor